MMTQGEDERRDGSANEQKSVQLAQVRMAAVVALGHLGQHVHRGHVEERAGAEEHGLARALQRASPVAAVADGQGQVGQQGQRRRRRAEDQQVLSIMRVIRVIKWR